MKKILLISLALVIALGGLGVGYAMWSDTVTIDGPVATGSLNLSFDYAEGPKATEYYYDATGKLQEGEYLGKNVGSTIVTEGDPEQDCATQKLGFETINIAVDNAYPGYYVATTFVLHNIGTVPLDVTLYSISGEKQELNGVKIYDLLWGSVGAGYWQSVYEDVNGNGVIDAGDPEVLNFRITNSLPVQIDPCKVEKREIDLHFKQPLQQLKKYTFSVVITAEQWAE